MPSGGYLHEATTALAWAGLVTIGAMMPMAPRSSARLMFSSVELGTRTSGMTPCAPTTATIAIAVSQLVGACSRSIVNQSKPASAICSAAITLVRLSQVPMVGSPRRIFCLTRFCFISSSNHPCSRRLGQPTAERQQVAALEVKADLRAGLLLREAVPGDPVDVGQHDHHWLRLGRGRRIGLQRHGLVVGVDQVPAVGRHDQRAVGAALDEIESVAANQVGGGSGIEIDHRNACVPREEVYGNRSRLETCARAAQKCAALTVARREPPRSSSRASSR